MKRTYDVCAMYEELPRFPKVIAKFEANNDKEARVRLQKLSQKPRVTKTLLTLRKVNRKKVVIDHLMTITVDRQK